MTLMRSTPLRVQWSLRLVLDARWGWVAMLFVMIGGAQFAAAALAATTPLIAQPQVLSPQGRVEVQRMGSLAWSPALPNQALQAGDVIRTGPGARVMIRLSNDGLVRLGPISLLRIHPGPPAPGKPWLETLQGLFHFFHKEKPQDGYFQSPLVSGAIRGTEFVGRVAEGGVTQVSVIEGEVELSNSLGSLLVSTGKEGEVVQASPPRLHTVAPGVNRVQWCLYYPAVLDPDELNLTVTQDDDLAGSMAAYRAGDLVAAFERVPQSYLPRTHRDRLFLAAVNLGVGRVVEADALLEAVPPLTDSEGRLAPLQQALRTLIEVTRSAGEAPSPVAVSPHGTMESPSLRLAWSYAVQAEGRLEEARAILQRLVADSPRFARAWARYAELTFASGRIKEARLSAEKALALAPRLPQGWVLKGFVDAAEGRGREAQLAFEQALSIDSALGEAWLGLGLIHLRFANEAEGVQCLLVAAAMEPNRSVFRSVLAKGFLQRGLDSRALRELEMAQRFDPMDPTPHLYRAWLLQGRNEANAAIRELRQAQKLNGNRQVYRSRALLDEDRSLRSANLSLLYEDAGWSELGLREAARAVQVDPSNPSAHLFLAGAYVRRLDPGRVALRYETVASTELLLANLLAPASAGVFSPRISYQDYTRLLDRPGLGLSSATEYRSHGQWSEQASQFGHFNSGSYSVDARYVSDPGTRLNQDLMSRSSAVSAKWAITTSDTLLLQVEQSDFESGDRRASLDPGAFNPTLRIEEKQQPHLLAGWHREWSPESHTLLLASHLQDDFRIRDSQLFVPTVVQAGGIPIDVTIAPLSLFDLDQRSNLEVLTGELQHLQTLGDHQFIVGIRHQALDQSVHSMLSKRSPSLFTYDVPVGVVGSALSRSSAYGYHTWRLLEGLSWVTGLSLDRLRMPVIADLPPLASESRSRSQLSPKAGLLWQSASSGSFRAGYARSLTGFSLDSSVRIEPTQVAGFNQAYRSLIPESLAGLTPGARTDTLGLGWDGQIDRDTHLGFEMQWLQAKASRGVGGYEVDAIGNPGMAIASPLSEALHYQEKSVAVDLHRLVGDWLTFGFRYQISQSELDRIIPALAPHPALGAFPGADLRTSAWLHQVRLRGQLNHPSGCFAGCEGVWTRQGAVRSNVEGLGLREAVPGEGFWHCNLSTGYRFARRRGEVSVGVLNVTGRNYRLHPISATSELPRERTMFVRFQWEL